MYKFSDKAQNQWSIEINIGTVIDVQEVMGYNLLDPAFTLDDVPLPAKLMTDDLLLSELVYVIIKNQLEKNGISKKEFFTNLDAQSIQLMSDAFINEYKAFFMSRGRRAVAQGLEEMQKAALQMFDIPLEQSSSKSEEVVSPSETQDN